MRTLPRFFLLLVLLLGACAHQPSLNEYGLHVVDSVAEYRETVRQHPANRLVDLEREIPGVRLDIRYATANNFMKQQLYPVAKAYLRRPAAEALGKVAAELRQQGIGIKIYDAYRPYSITKLMWEPYKNPDYVADPAKGSRHNRGAAVDLTLINLSSGDELEMPTPYDDFTERAGYSFTDLPAGVARNRALLRETMERHGFQALASEWWHFDFVGWETFDLMDIPLETLPSIRTGESFVLQLSLESSRRCPQVRG